MRTLFLLVGARANQSWGRFPPLVFNTSGLYRRFSEAVGYAAARVNPRADHPFRVISGPRPACLLGAEVADGRAGNKSGSMTASGAMPTVGGSTPRQRRRLILGALLRALLAATLLVALYYVLPMDSALDTHTVLLLVLCLAVLAAVLTWQIRVITNSRYPGLRALETVAAVVPLYILAFATTYFLTERADGAYFSEPLTRSSALYFSVTVFSTVGFGDITAKADPARLIVTAQMFFDLILLGFGARVFLGAVKLGRQRHAPDQPERQES